MPDPQPLKIPQRPLRDGSTISAVVWEVNRVVDRESLVACRALEANWFMFPATLSIDAIAPWRDELQASDHLIVGVDSDDLVARRNSALVERLEALGRSNCDAVMLQEVDTDSLKAGRPFHRLSQLRDAGLTRMIFLDAASAEIAEWMTENTPAHAVAVPYDLSNQTARYRLFDVAKEMETRLLSRPASVRKLSIEAPADEAIAFRLADPHVTAIVEPLFESVEQLHQIAHAAVMTLPQEQLDDWWRKYQEKVPPPPKPKRGHPPEYGS
jgi:aryl-alcohol dehydrogenase-like predicted oxidoreductase